jgi:hypothetical protein
MDARSWVRVAESDSGSRVEVDSYIESDLLRSIYGHALGQSVRLILRRAVRQGMRRAGPYSIEFPRGAEREAHALAGELRQSLQRAVNLPIEQSRVEAALGITRKECNRWTKDGRLPTSGTLIISRAINLRIQRSTYPPEMIADLVGHPERIAAWRADDSRKPKITGSEGPADVSHPGGD